MSSHRQPDFGADREAVALRLDGRLSTDLPSGSSEPSDAGLNESSLTRGVNTARQRSSFCGIQPRDLRALSDLGWLVPSLQMQVFGEPLKDTLKQSKPLTEASTQPMQQTQAQQRTTGSRQAWEVNRLATLCATFRMQRGQILLHNPWCKLSGFAPFAERYSNPVAVIFAQSHCRLRGAGNLEIAAVSGTKTNLEIARIPDLRLFAADRTSLHCHPKQQL